MSREDFRLLANGDHRPLAKEHSSVIGFSTPWVVAKLLSQNEARSQKTRIRYSFDGNALIQHFVLMRVAVLADINLWASCGNLDAGQFMEDWDTNGRLLIWRSGLFARTISPVRLVPDLPTAL